MREGRCGVLGEASLPELEGVAGLHLGRLPAVLGRLPAVVRRDEVVFCVVVRRTVGMERAGEAPLLKPIAGDTLLVLMAAEMMSGDEVPTPAGECPGGRVSTGGKVQSSIMGM